MDQRTKSRDWLVIACSLAALLAIAAAGTLIRRPAIDEADAGPAAVADCDLAARSCRRRLADGSGLELSITPRPIPLAAPLVVELSIDGGGPAMVEVDFRGESMDMGYNRSRLAAVGDGRYRGTATIPVCMTGAMTWIATVAVERDGQRLEQRFRFRTGQ